MMKLYCINLHLVTDKWPYLEKTKIFNVNRNKTQGHEIHYTLGLMQDCSISSAVAMELRQPCNKLYMYFVFQ